MDQTTLADLRAKLRQFETRLQRQRHEVVKSGSHLATLQVPASLQSDERTMRLQAKLRATLAVSQGVDWNLLKLELQNDLLLLANSFNHWTHQLDNRFNKSA